MVEQRKNKPQAPTKDEMRQMLAQAVRNTQPELNPVRKTKKVSSPRPRSRQR
jgi:hypothetical protein